MSNQASNILSQNAEQRFHYLISAVCEYECVWVLTDEHGCMMLNSEDEDCLPVWPSEQYAQAWATGEWQQCQATAIELSIWQSKWTKGLTEDALMLVVFPNEQQEGWIIDPQYFQEAITKKQQKLAR